jgi:DNA polymerase
MAAAAKERVWLEENFGIEGVYASRTRRAAARETKKPSSSARVLERVAAEVKKCTLCDLYKKANNGVPGEGNPNAEIMFIGEGPGYDEDRLGRPFVGRAGKLLDRIITAMGLERGEVYITNVVKHRPPENRMPTKFEIAKCNPYLVEQIDAIQPKIICVLGGPAAQTLLNTEKTIGALRGTFHRYPERPEILLMPTYHPAYLLRNPNDKRKVWEDVKKIMEAVGRPVREK